MEMQCLMLSLVPSMHFPSVVAARRAACQDFPVFFNGSIFNKNN